MPDIAKTSDAAETEDFTERLDIDVSKIPDSKRDALVEPLLPLLATFYAQPGIQEKFEAWREARNLKSRRST